MNTNNDKRGNEVTDQPIQMIALSKLKPSPYNVRTVIVDSAADRELLAGIEARGLTHNLVVAAAKRGTFEVLDGGRRLAALNHLASEGKLEKDAAQPCKVVSGDDALLEEISLMLNIQRAELHPADKFLSFTRLAEKGMTEKDIAAHFGIKVAEVKRLLKLGSVHPEIVQAYRDGKLYLDDVMAFAVGDDQERQLGVFKSLKRYEMSPWHIRSRLLDTCVRESDPKVKFVGLKAYKAAGGTVTRDLFQSQSYLNDAGLLDRLVQEKLQAEAEKLKADGWGWVDVVDDSPYEIENGYPQLNAEYDAPAELESSIERMERRQDDIESGFFGSDLSEEEHAALSEELDAIEKQLDELHTQREQYRVVADPSAAGCVIGVGHDGKPRIVTGLLKPGEASDDGKTSPAPPKSGISQALHQDLLAWRQQAVQVAMVQSPEIALDLLFFQICRDVLSNTYTPPVLGVRADSWPRDDLKPAAEALEEMRATMPVDWRSSGSTGDQFRAFNQAVSGMSGQQLIAYCIAKLFSPEQFAEIAEGLLTPDLQVAPINIDIRKYWTPTADNYFSRIKREDLLAIGTELLGDDWLTHHKSMKKADLAKYFHKLFNELEELKLQLNLDELERIMTWLPAEMRT